MRAASRWNNPFFPQEEGGIDELQDLMEMQGNPPETLEDFVRLHMKAAVRQSAVNPPVRELESENSAEDE